MILPINHYQNGLDLSLQHKTSSKVPYGRDFQMCMGDPGIRRDICYHLLKSWHRPLPAVFTCCWQENNRTSWRRDVGAGYYSGGVSTYLEVCEEGLEISRVLDGLEIDGIYSGGITSCIGYLSDSCVVELLIKNWEDFFLREPDGVYVQYVYRVSGLAVSLALEAFPKRDQVLVVAVNITTPVQHSRQIALRLHDYCCGKTPQEMLMSRYPGNSGALSLRFSDPTFYSLIMCAYSLEIHYKPDCDADVESTSMTSLPGCPHLLHPISTYEPIILRYVRKGILFDHLQQVNDACLAGLEGRELWNEALLAKISWFVVGCVRMLDYLLVVIKTRRLTNHWNAIGNHLCMSNTTGIALTSQQASYFTHMNQTFHVRSLKTGIAVWVAECLWAVFSVAQAFIIFSMLKKNPDLRLLPLHCNILGYVLTGLDLVYNVYMASVGASSIHCALGCYDMVFLVRAISCFMPKIRQNLQHSAILITNWRSIGYARSASVAVVSNTFRNIMKKARVFLEIVFLLVISGLFFTRHLITSSQEEHTVEDLIHVIFSSTILLLIVYILQTKHSVR